jgi:hypothetical protein
VFGKKRNNMKIKSDVNVGGDIEMEGTLKTSGGNLEFYVGGTRVFYIDSSGDMHVKGDVIIESTTV